MNERLGVEVHDLAKAAQRPVPTSSEVKPYIFSIIFHRTGSSGRTGNTGSGRRGIFLEHDAVAILDAPALGRLAADPLDAADDLMALDERHLEAVWPRAVEGGPVNAADAGQLDADEAGVLVGLRHRNLPHLDLARPDRDRSPGFHRHVMSVRCLDEKLQDRHFLLAVDEQDFL